MSQRESGYERKERDLYETPAWATEALLPHLRPLKVIWEPACASGKMVRVLATVAEVWGCDIEPGAEFVYADFLGPTPRVDVDYISAIITNPPYELATEFIERALDRTRHLGGLVAMLLRTDFDHAKTRARLFADHPAFAKKVVLTRRIRWFEDSKGSPSFNHAWFIWDWLHVGAPTLAYGPLTVVGNVPMTEIVDRGQS
jgi:hypothetical protein